ncbi:glycosyltransferase [candidate division KSB1 bacterium]|nr:glycosyltransferase [candidate division KSB1 bacterium]
MLKDRDIVVFALPRWDGVYESTSFTISKELARNNRVLYVDNPFTWKDVLTRLKSPQMKRRWRGFLPFSDGLIQYQEGEFALAILVTTPVVPMNFLPAGPIYRYVSGWNHHIVGQRIKQAVKLLQFKNYIYINSWNFHYPDIDQYLMPELYVYHCVDSIIKPYNLRHGPAMEIRLARKSDLIISTARALQEKYAAYNSQSYFVPNAANFELSSQALNSRTTIPNELQHVKKPIIGFFGHIERRIDYELLIPIIQNHPEWTFAFVGPVDRVYFPAALEKMPNVKLTGAQPYAQMPNFLKAFDVAMIPFKVDDVSNTIYPLKLYEYLGAGKPVVVTPFNPDILEQLVDVIYVADTASNFEGAIVTALKENSQLKINARLDVARANTWEARGKEFSDLIERALNNIHDEYKIEQLEELRSV